MQKLPALIASALLMGGALQMHADEVTLTTALTTGQNLTLALNPDITAQLAWGNGETQTVESDGTLQSIPVKDSKLTISVTDGEITRLYVQGNKLTELDLSGAENIVQLFCADNQLTTLSLTKNKSLEVLDVQDNQLSKLSASGVTTLKELDVARNELTTLSLASAARPTMLVCAENNLKSLPTATVLSELKSLWVRSNSLTSLPIGQAKNLHSLSASSNSISSINLIKNPQLVDLWLENNNLKTIDMSKGTPKLYSFCADHNSLTTVTWDTNAKKTCRYVYLNNNALFINSMPSLIYGGTKLSASIMPQSNYVIDNYYDAGATIDLNDLVAKNGWGVGTVAKVNVVGEDGNALTDKQDYTESSKKFTFPSIQKGLHFEVTSSAYTDITFRTVKFNIGTTEAINTVSSNTDKLNFRTSRGLLIVEPSAPTAVHVYSAAGTRIVSEQLSAGSHTWVLPSGVYVVNGHKVMVP